MAQSKTTYEGAGKHLNKVTTGPNKNVLYRYAPVGGATGEYNKVKNFKDKTDAEKWVKEAIESTGRITDEKFLELRNSNKAMNNLEFANFLNKKTDFKGIRGEKFTPHNVRNRQILLDVGPTGEKLEFALSKKEVLDTVKDMKDGPQKIKDWRKAGSTDQGFKNLESIVRKKKNYERIKEEGYFETKGYKTRRKKALSKYEQSGKAKIARLKTMETKGIFPMGDPELDLWRDLYLSSQTKNPRLVLKTKKPKTVLTKQGNKIIPWYTDDNYKKVKFLDTQTGKTITFNNLKKYLGEEKYNKVLRPYQEKHLIKDTEIMYKGQKRKVATLINEGVFGPVKDYPVEGYFHVHHPTGKGKDPFFTQLASWDANKAEWRPRENLIKKINKAEGFGAKREIVEEFIENTKKFNIYTQPGKTLYGTDIPFQEKLKIAGQEAGLKGKNWNQLINKSKALNLAHALELSGVTDICSPQLVKKAAAEGGRIGFARKCGMEFAKSDPDGFMRIAKTSEAAEDAFKSGKVIQALKGAKNWAKSNMGPAGWIGGELLVVGLGTAWDMSQGKGWKEAMDNWAGLGGHFGKAEDRLREIGIEQGYSEAEINDAMKIGQLMDLSTEVEEKQWDLDQIQEQQDIGGTARVKYNPNFPGAYKPIQGQYQDPRKIRELKTEVPKMWEKGTELYESLKDFPTSEAIYGSITGAKESEEQERKSGFFDWLREKKILADKNWQSQVPRAEGGIMNLKKKW